MLPILMNTPIIFLIVVIKGIYDMKRFTRSDTY